MVQQKLREVDIGLASRLCLALSIKCFRRLSATTDPLVIALSPTQVHDYNPLSLPWHANTELVNDQLCHQTLAHLIFLYWTLDTLTNIYEDLALSFRENLEVFIKWACPRAWRLPFRHS